jgi:hypothetical protein
MQKRRNEIYFAVGAIILAVAALWYWMMPVECVSEIQVSIGDENAEVSTSKDISDVVFRMNSAVEYIEGRSSISNLVEKYVLQNPDCPVNKAYRLLENVHVEQEEKIRNVWTVKAIAQTSKEAKNVAEFYVERIIQYFSEEQNRFERKMLAWFDQQIYHRRKRNDNALDLEKAKHDRLRKEQARVIKIKKNCDLKIKRLFFGWWFNGTVEKE